MKDESGKVVFDAEEQAKVDEIVKERLSRHKPDDYDDLKEVYDDIGEFFEGTTIAEKKANIKALKEAQKQQALTEEVEEFEVEDEDDIPNEDTLNSIAKKLGTTPDKVENAFKVLIEKQTKEETDKILKADWEKQQQEFIGKYPDLDLAQLEKDEDFIEYTENRVGTLLNIYEAYVKFTSKRDQKTADEIRAKFKSKELLSTGTGKGGANDNTGLSQQEKETLELWNKQNPHLKMSATEFKNRK